MLGGQRSSSFQRRNRKRLEGLYKRLIAEERAVEVGASTEDAAEERVRRLVSTEEALVRAQIEHAIASGGRDMKNLQDRLYGPIDRPSVEVTAHGPIRFISPDSPSEPLAVAEEDEALDRALSRGARLHHRDGSAGRENGARNGDHG